MANPFAAAAAIQRRASTFAGANQGPLYADWRTALLSPDREIQYSLRVLRGRARWLVRNNPYIAGFVQAFADNVVGAEGITLQAKVRNRLGNLQEKTNFAIEAAWKEWDFPENASLDGCDSWVDLQRLAAQCLPTDGEVFFRERKGAGNAFGYALQQLDPDLLDETYDVPPDRDGVEIRMGVELDRDGRPLAYHFWKRHPADRYFSRNDRVRIPAAGTPDAERDGGILHLFVRYRPGQTRGVTWYAPVLTSVKMLDGYTEAELVAARTAAAKMGFFQQTKDAAGGLVTSASPQGGAASPTMSGGAGSIDFAPAGYEFREWDPQHPNSAFGDFVKAILRGVARALGVSYLTLVGDLREANYSSMRAGLLPERDHYRVLQVWFAKRFHRRVYRSWVGMALVSGAVKADSRLASDHMAVEWQGRGWTWVDPVKDLDAAERAIRLGLDSRKRLSAERGRDFEDNVDEIAEEESYARRQGVSVAGMGSPAAATPAPAVEDEGGDELDGAGEDRNDSERARALALAR